MDGQQERDIDEPRKIMKASIHTDRDGPEKDGKDRSSAVLQAGKTGRSGATIAGFGMFRRARCQNAPKNWEFGGSSLWFIIQTFSSYHVLWKNVENNARKFHLL